VHDVIAAIHALNLESVKVRIMDADLGEGWTREYADSVEAAYRTYLTMLVKYPDCAEDILLSKDVDEFWHTHILQTMKYADDCESVFGQFLHHLPHVGEVTAADHQHRAKQAEKTRQLYEREFGGELDAVAAWSGNSIQAGAAAMSNVGLHAEDAAMSNVAIRSERAAMSNAAIRAGAAAMSNAAIRAGAAAMSNVSFRAENAAMSNAAILPEHAAMSNVGLRDGSAARHSAVARA